MPDPRRFEQWDAVSESTEPAAQKLLIRRYRTQRDAGPEHVASRDRDSAGQPERANARGTEISQRRIQFDEREVGALHSGPADRAGAGGEPAVRRVNKEIERDSRCRKL